ncbi:MAG: hypothetical protein MHM6MM_000465 [Cercozoa sp. M6MM]
MQACALCTGPLGAINEAKLDQLVCDGSLTGYRAVLDHMPTTWLGHFQGSLHDVCREMAPHLSTKETEMFEFKHGAACQLLCPSLESSAVLPRLRRRLRMQQLDPEKLEALFTEARNEVRKREPDDLALLQYFNHCRVAALASASAIDYRNGSGGSVGHTLCLPNHFGTIHCMRGDLARAPVQAVLHPTNSRKEFNGAIGRSLLRATNDGGTCLLRNTKANNNPLPRTQALAVPSEGSLSARYVVHVNLPSYKNSDSEELLRASLEAALRECATQHVRTVALPALGTGRNRYPADLAAKVLLKTAVQFLKTDTSLSYIFFLLYDQKALDTYHAALTQLMFEV